MATCVVTRRGYVVIKLVGEIEREIVPDLDPDPSYLDQEGWEDRRAEYMRGDFAFIGVRAVATVEILNVRQVLRSPGLWGVEDDSGDDYIAEIFEDEKATMLEMLAEMGVLAVAGA
jgi:hypothetical protein